MEIPFFLRVDYFFSQNKVYFIKIETLSIVGNQDSDNKDLKLTSENVVTSSAASSHYEMKDLHQDLVLFSNTGYQLQGNGNKYFLSKSPDLVRFDIWKSHFYTEKNKEHHKWIHYGNFKGLMQVEFSFHNV